VELLSAVGRATHLRIRADVRANGRQRGKRTSAMHPILFRIPLPNANLPLGWILVGAALIAVALAAWQFAAKKQQNALVLGGVALALAAAWFFIVRKDPTLNQYALSAIPIYSYGVMLGLSLVVGWYLTLGLAERDGLPKEIMANNYVVTAVAAVVGSRILYILTNLDEFSTVGSMFEFRRGGLVAYGGFLGGFLGSLLFLRRYRIPLLPWADVAVPSLASGLMITRIGCYLFGCDFGKPLTEGAPALLKKLGTFPHWAEATLDHGAGAPAWAQHVKQGLIPATAEASLPVHPTQIYESLVGAGLLVFLLVMRRYQTFRGQIFLLFTFAYGVCRFILEIFRDDLERGSIPPALPEHLLLTLGLLVLSVGYVMGISKMIDNVAVRRATQIAAFLPPLAVYFIKRPETFAQAVTYQFSTSQFVAITSGFAACVAFDILLRGAKVHPESAMSLGLPKNLGEEPEEAGEAAADDEEEEEERVAARTAQKARALGAAKPAPAPAADEQAARRARKKAKKARQAAATPAAPTDAGGEDGDGDGDTKKPEVDASAKAEVEQAKKPVDGDDDDDERDAKKRDDDD
jgi:phosphatidylglycerol:prolipoprotein diacylglycerol transferase